MKNYLSKLILMLFICITAGVITSTVYKYSVLNTTDFEIKQCFIMRGDEYKSTRINVVACAENYNPEKLMNKIKIFYELQSGKANRLDIILFDNTEDFIEFKNYTQRVFEQ